MGNAEMIRTQKQHVLARFGMSAVVLPYLIIHNPALASHPRDAMVALMGYAAFNLLCIPWIAWRPNQPLRILLAASADTALAAGVMWLDGGLDSPAYILLLIISMGHGVRYGNAIMLYSQILGMLALGFVGLMGEHGLQHSVNRPHLMMQIVVMMIVPGYIHYLGKRLENALSNRLRAEKDSAGMLESSPMPAFTFSSDIFGDSTIRYANHAMTALLDLPRKKLAGQPVERLAIHEDAKEIRNGCNQVLNGDEQQTTCQFAIRCRTGEGQIRSLMCRATAIRWRGKKTGLCILDDVTENEQLHEQLEHSHRQDYINSLLAGLTHDFRNVLTHMIGNAEILHMQAENASDAERLKLIIEAGERGSEMITQLLRMARRKKTPKSLFNLQDTLPSTIRLAHLKLPEHIALEFEMDDDLPPLFGHAVQIDQVILNLIENASHAVGKSGRIRVEVRRDAKHALASPGAPAVRICVADNGCGIPEKDLPYVFDTFWTSREKAGGSGLGLTMSKRIVTWHHGEITLSSSPGGTTITIILPPAENAAHYGEASAASNTATTPA